MKRLAFLLICVYLFSIFFRQNVYGEEKTFDGSFTRLSGQVKVRRANSTEWDNAEENMPVYSADQIRTGANSEAEITFDEGTIIRLEENSYIIINEAVLEEKTKLKRLVVKANKGRVLSNLEKFAHPKSKFEIQGPGGVVAAARGTEFLVEISPDEKVEVAVFGGVVGVKNEKIYPGKEIFVNEEKETVVEPGKEPFAPRNLTEKFLKYREEKIKNFHERVAKNRQGMAELRRRRMEWIEKKKTKRLERIKERKRQMEMRLDEKRKRKK